MSKPICVTTTLPAVSQALVEINLEQIASQTKLIVRKTEGFHAEGFLLSLLQAVAEGHGSLQQIACNLAQTSSSRPLARQAIHYRMNERALNFLQETTTQLLAAKITPAHLPNPTAPGRILLQDATQLTLPKQNATHYRGISNQYGKKSSAKLDLTKELRSGQIIALSSDHGTKQDRVSAKELTAHLEPGDLILRDMGYYNTDLLEQMTALGCHYITRLPANTDVNLLDQKTSLETHLKNLPPSQVIVDLPVTVRGQNPSLTRLIAIRCPQEITERKRAKSKAHRQKMGSQPTKRTLQREGWTIYLTSYPKEERAAREIHQIYRLRWNIEITFRAFKGSSQSKNLLKRIVKNQTHLSILLEAFKIYAILISQMESYLNLRHPKHQQRLSIEKIAKWLAQMIPKITHLTRSKITYDLRYFLHEKRKDRPTQKDLLNALF